jgi:hypothetical protein
MWNYFELTLTLLNLPRLIQSSHHFCLCRRCNCNYCMLHKVMEFYVPQILKYKQLAHLCFTHTAVPQLSTCQITQSTAQLWHLFILVLIWRGRLLVTDTTPGSTVRWPLPQCHNIKDRPVHFKPIGNRVILSTAYLYTLQLDIIREDSNKQQEVHKFISVMIFMIHMQDNSSRYNNPNK